MREDGAFIVHAHPFRRAYYIDPFVPQPELYDGIEVFNARNADHAWDRRALKMAQSHNRIMTAGSDAHEVSEVSEGAVELPWPVHDMPGLIEALRTQRCGVIEQFNPQGVYHG